MYGYKGKLFGPFTRLDGVGITTESKGKGSVRTFRMETTMKATIRIEAEEIRPLADAVFIRAARNGSLPDPKVPGYVLTVTEGRITEKYYRNTLDEAIEYAEYMKDNDPEVTIILS
jgi:hypothetical protein